MKTKNLFIAIIALFCLMSCKTTREVSTSTNTQKVATEWAQQDTRTGSGSVAATTQSKTETETQKYEVDSIFYTKFSAPDSIGRQHIIETGGGVKKSAENTKTVEDWEHSVNAQLDFLFTKIDQLEQQLYKKNETEIKIEPGLTWWQKMQIYVRGGWITLVVFFGIYIAIKWYLKFKK